MLWKSKILCLVVVLLCLAVLMSYGVEKYTQISSAVRGEFYHLIQAIEQYYVDYNKYPPSLAKAWNRPGLQHQSALILDEWEYTTDKDGISYTLRNKAYKKVLINRPLNKARRLDLIASPISFLRIEGISNMVGSDEDLLMIKKVISSDADPEVRTYAVFQLEKNAQFDCSKPILIEALLDTDFTVWEAASRLLCRHGGEEIVKEMKSWAGAAEKAPKIQAAHGLANTHIMDRIDLLEILARDSSTEVRAATADSILYDAPPQPQRVITLIESGMKDEDSNVAMGWTRAAARLGMPESIPGLEKALAKSKKTDDIITNLESMNWVKTDDATKVIKHFLNSPESRVRACAARLIRNRQYDTYEEDMIKLLSDKEPEIRLQAIDNLWQQHKPETLIPHILKLLDDPDRHTRFGAARMFFDESPCGCPGHIYPSSIGKLQDPRTVEPLTRRMLTDPDDGVRLAAGITLMIYKNPDTSDAMIKALNDTAQWRHYHALYCYAAYCLEEMKVSLPVETMKNLVLILNPTTITWVGQYARNFPEQETLRKAVLDEVPKRLQSDDENVVVGALTALQIYPDPELAEKIMALSHNVSPVVRRASISALDKYRSPEWHRRLRELVNDGDANVQIYALASLPQFQDKKDLQLLTSMYKERKGIRINLIPAIANYQSPDAMTFLVGLIDQCDDQEFRGICNSLQQRLAQEYCTVDDIKTISEKLEKRASHLNERDRHYHPVYDLLGKIDMLDASLTASLITCHIFAAKKDFSAGDEVRIRFMLQNLTPHDLPIDTRKYPPDDQVPGGGLNGVTLNIHDNTGKTIKIHGLVRHAIWFLPEEYEKGHVPDKIAAKEQFIRDVLIYDPKTKEPFPFDLSKPGTYTIEAVVDLKKLSPEENLMGEIRSKPIEIEIKSGN